MKYTPTFLHRICNLFATYLQPSICNLFATYLPPFFQNQFATFLQPICDPFASCHVQGLLTHAELLWWLRRRRRLPGGHMAASCCRGWPACFSSRKPPGLQPCDSARASLQTRAIFHARLDCTWRGFVSSSLPWMRLIQITLHTERMPNSVKMSDYFKLMDCCCQKAYTLYFVK